jgi:pyruvate,water dikinase
MSKPIITKLDEAQDITTVGGKAHALGKLLRAGFNVPAGFVITTNAAARSPTNLQVEIIKYFDSLKSQFVAVRSSAVSEDSGNATWAGQLDTYLNTQKDKLLENIEKCQNSINSARAQSYAEQKSLSKSLVAVIIQEMIQSDISGVAFSVHPVTNDHNIIIIEAGFGLGEAIVSGQITPDTYIIEKNTNIMLEKIISNQTRKLSKIKSGETTWQTLGEGGKSQKLTDNQVCELACIIQKLEQYFGHPVDVEWALRDDIFYILQSRPITTIPI